jgi:hypothetical protein
MGFHLLDGLGLRNVYTCLWSPTEVVVNPKGGADSRSFGGLSFAFAP